MKRIIIFIAVIFMTISFLSVAQEVSKKELKDTKTSSIKLSDETQATGDDVKIIDDENNILLKIIDEGKFGSIELPSGVPITTTNKLYNDSGILNFNGTALGSGGASVINDLGDAIHDASSLFLGFGAGINDDGTTNRNTAVGLSALAQNTTGYQNTAKGWAVLYSNITGHSNIANGYMALFTNTSGHSNIANGSKALYSNTTGRGNTANGYRALYSNTSGEYNTANGREALFSNTTGSINTANGNWALHLNTTGIDNTANGHAALSQNTTGDHNTANGSQALTQNTTGYDNTAGGWQALFVNQTGHSNTAYGALAMASSRTGNSNVCIGKTTNVLNSTGSQNTIIGCRAGITTSTNHGSGNVFLGYEAGYDEFGDNKLYIENSNSSSPLIGGDFSTDEVYLNGKVGIGTMSPTKKLHVYTDNTSEIALYENESTSDPDGIIIKAGPDILVGPNTDYMMFQDGDGDNIGSIDGTGFGGVNYNTTSDARLKTNIRDYNGGLQALTKIKVRQYEMKVAPNFVRIGLIAQELQEVYPQAVSGSPDSDVSKEPMMVDYGRITPLLIQAMQEQQEIIEELRDRITQLEAEKRN